MMNWFEAIAPVRQKMFVAFATMISFMVAILGLSFLGLIGQAVGAGLVLVASYLASRFRTAVCDPYVTTVVRMEALAAGDLTSPIRFGDYHDCVGRLSRGMVTFRDAAVAQRRSGEEQADVVRILGESLAKLTNGDLTAEVTAEVPPAYDVLKDNFNEALASLRALIGSVADSAVAIRTGSGEIAQASEDLARRTETNAANLEQTTAAVTQIDGRLKATADAAARTLQRADDAIATVEGGRNVANGAVQAMARVADGAKGIDSVIEGLDKIAFQTRVLAMNAAVEAGRAGEAGRGFAVVADLVSALAMRSEEEAARARDQLTATQGDIVSAVEMVQKVDGSLATISGDVGGVHTLLGQMAADNRAQSTAISEISAAIGTMDQSTQQNAAMVEQTSAAARNLTNEVAALADQAAKFEVGLSRSPRSFAPREASGHAQKRNASPVGAPLTPCRTRISHDDWASF
jgi:methyl-accepting chemotaxis protein